MAQQPMMDDNDWYQGFYLKFGRELRDVVSSGPEWSEVQQDQLDWAITLFIYEYIALGRQGFQELFESANFEGKGFRETFVRNTLFRIDQLKVHLRTDELRLSLQRVCELSFLLVEDLGAEMRPQWLMDWLSPILEANRVKLDEIYLTDKRPKEWVETSEQVNQLYSR